MLPFRFLTPAVFAFFRPLQFWVLTTQPLFCFSAFFSVPPPSGFPVAPSLLSLLRFFRFSPDWFPILSIRFCLLSFAVCFLSPFPVSLPQLFHRCLPSFRFLSSPYFRPPSCFASLSFVRSRFSSSGYSAFSLFRSASSRFRLAPASSVPGRFFRRFRFPLISRLISHPFLPVLLTWFSASFLFVLPNFAPAAVPLVLALSSASFPLLLL